jgi:signal peptidase I
LRLKKADAASSHEVSGAQGAPPSFETAGAERTAPVAEAALDGKKEKKPRRLLGTVIEIVVIVAAAFALALLVQAFLMKPFTVHQVSMEPTLMEGDRILLSRVTYRFRDPRAGDVVVFHSPLNTGEDLVKRIVAVSGDTVAVRDGNLYVNGVAVGEPYLLNEDFGGTFSALEVPEDCAFVMGDNRDQSGDSRFFGPINLDLIIGKAFCVYWPIGRWGGI